MADDTTARVSAVRDELTQTLDEIGDKLNPRKQVPHLVASARASWRRDPVPWIIGGGLAVVLIAGAVAWAFLSDD